MNLYKKFFFLFLTFIYINCQTYICNSNDASDLKIGDTIADTDCYREYLDNEEIKDLMSTLTDEEKNIINWRYGLKNTKKCTLEEVSQKLGYSKERIRQKENLAIEKLKIKQQCM